MQPSLGSLQPSTVSSNRQQPCQPRSFQPRQQFGMGGVCVPGKLHRSWELWENSSRFFLFRENAGFRYCKGVKSSRAQGTHRKGGSPPPPHTHLCSNPAPSNQFPSGGPSAPLSRACDGNSLSLLRPKGGRLGLTSQEAAWSVSAQVSPAPALPHLGGRLLGPISASSVIEAAAPSQRHA